VPASAPTTPYGTTDIAVAAYLRCAGYRLISVKRIERGRMSFYFAADGRSPVSPAEAAISFVTSEQARFDQVKRGIKKLVFTSSSQSMTGTKGDWSTTYLPHAAYLVMLGGKLCGYRRTNAERRSYEFYFDGDPKWYDRTKEDYQDSGVARYDRMMWELQNDPMGDGGVA